MKIAIKCIDGSVQIMTLVKGAAEDAIGKWKQQWPGKYVSHREMPDDAIPTDRTFREAWTDTTPEAVIDIDMAKAREIHLTRLRAERDALLIKLDQESIKAQDQGLTEELQIIRATKQALRDLPDTIQADLAAAKTTDELKQIRPELLDTSVQRSVQKD
jgi:hypothetical protein